MNIYIISSGRADRQPTWNSLTPELQARTRLVIPPDEVRAYHKFPHICDPGIHHVGKIRQWIADNEKDSFIMLDDDLTFSVRRTDNPTKFYNAGPFDVEKIFNKLEELVGNGAYAHAGVAMREGGNRNTNDYTQCVRMARVLAYHLPTLREVGVRFDRCLGMDDFDATLQLLREGYPNILINWAVQNQYGSNSRGGASSWRTLEVQEQSANLLHSHHPEFVTTVRKQTKVSWGGKERTDVIVQWKRALGSSHESKR